MTPEERRELDAVINRIRGVGSPLRGWRILALQMAARWIREVLCNTTLEAELELDLRDLADELEELAGFEKRDRVEGRIERRKARPTPPEGYSP